ncbi:MAG: phosphodiester glycosidase family protein [Bacilli bacterium]|nr:phosphodiester glycosidase family protein [Bacilli bacterium]
MAVLLDTGELQGLNSTVSNLEQQSVNIRTVNNTINEFKSGANGVLAGGTWKQAGVKLSLYMDAMSKCCEAANALSQAIAAAIAALTAVWDPRFGESVDDQYRAETQAEYNRISEQIDALYAQLADADDEEYDPGIAAAIQGLQVELAEVESLLNAIDAFLEEYHRQEEILNRLSSELDSLSTAISGIAASDGFNYNSSSLSGIDFSQFIGLDTIAPITVHPVGYYGGHTTTYTGNNNNGTTFRYHVLNKNDYDLKLQVADGLNSKNPYKATSFTKLAAASGGDVVINAGRVQRGPIIADGEVLRSSGVSPVSDGGATLYFKNGTMGSINNVEGHHYTGDSQLEEINPDWAVMGWFPTVVDGKDIPKEEYPKTWNMENITNGRNPLSFVAVTQEGDYVLGDTGGKRGECTEQGVYPWDINECLKEEGIDADFVYVLDGGGSVAMSENGEQVANTYDGRNLPTAIAAVPKENTDKKEVQET